MERRAESGIVLQPIDFYDKTIGVDASQSDRQTDRHRLIVRSPWQLYKLQLHLIVGMY